MTSTNARPELSPAPEAQTALKPRAYSYVRFSTPDQIRGDSLRRQTEAARIYAATHGLTLMDESYQDLGISGFTGKNRTEGELSVFIEAIDDGKIAPGSYLLVENLDRLSREGILEAAILLLSIVSKNINVVSLMDGQLFSRETVNNNIVPIVIAVSAFQRANEESTIKGRRVRAAWDNKRELAVASKTLLTAKVPGWLRVEGGKVLPIPARVSIVKRIFREFLAGSGQGTIAKGLNADAVPCFGRATQWHSSYIKRVLNGPAVLGEVTPHTSQIINRKRTRIPQEPIKGYYPAVIAESVFERARELAAGKGTPRYRASGGGIKNVLAGLATCPQCAGAMIRVNKGSRRVYPKLVCSKARSKAGCKYVSVDYREVEAAVLKGLPYEVYVAPRGESPDLANAMGHAEAEVRALEEGLSSLLDLAERGDKSQGLLERLRAREKDLETAREVVEELRAKVAQESPVAVNRKLRAIEDAVESGNVATINAALRVAVESVTIDYDRGMLDLTWKHGGESSVSYRFIGFERTKKGGK